MIYYKVFDTVLQKVEGPAKLTMQSDVRSNRVERGTPSKGGHSRACPGPARYAKQTGDQSHSAGNHQSINQSNQSINSSEPVGQSRPFG